MESLGAGSNTVPVINMAVFLKQKENSWSSGHSAFFLTSLPLQPCGNRNPVNCRNEYDEKGIESTAAKAGHDT
jgi:hypothetical protein